MATRHIGSYVLGEMTLAYLYSIAPPTNNSMVLVRVLFKGRTLQTGFLNIAPNAIEASCQSKDNLKAQ